MAWSLAILATSRKRPAADHGSLLAAARNFPAASGSTAGSGATWWRYDIGAAHDAKATTTIAVAADHNQERWNPGLMREGGFMAEEGASSIGPLSRFIML